MNPELLNRLDEAFAFLQVARGSAKEVAARDFSIALGKCLDSISINELDKGSFETTEASAFFNHPVDLLISVTKISDLAFTSPLFKTFSDRLAALMKTYFNRSTLSNEARAKRAVLLECIKNKMAEISPTCDIGSLRAAVIEAEEALKPDTPPQSTLTATMTTATAVAAEATAAATRAAAAKTRRWLARWALREFATVPPSGVEVRVATPTAPPVAAAAAGGAGVSAVAKTETTEKDLESRVQEAIEAYQNGSLSSAVLIALIGLVMTELSTSRGVSIPAYSRLNPEEIQTTIKPSIKSALLYTKLLQRYLSPAEALKLWEHPLRVLHDYLLLSPHRLDDIDPDGSKRHALIEAIKNQLNRSKESFLNEPYNALIVQVSELRGEFNAVYPQKSLTERVTKASTAVAASAGAAAAAAGARVSALEVTTITAARGGPLGRVGEVTATMLEKAGSKLTLAAAATTAAATAAASATAVRLASTTAAAAAATTAAVVSSTGASLAVANNPATAATPAPRATGLSVVIPTEPPPPPARTPISSSESMCPLPLEFLPDITAALTAVEATNTAAVAGGRAAAPSPTTNPSTEEFTRRITHLKHTLVIEKSYSGILGIFYYLCDFDDRKGAKIEFLDLWLLQLRNPSVSSSEALRLAEAAMRRRNPQRAGLAQAGLFSNRVASLVKLVTEATSQPTRTPGVSAR